MVSSEPTFAALFKLLLEKDLLILLAGEGPSAEGDSGRKLCEVGIAACLIELADCEAAALIVNADSDCGTLPVVAEVGNAAIDSASGTKLPAMVLVVAEDSKAGTGTLVIRRSLVGAGVGEGEEVSSAFPALMVPIPDEPAILGMVACERRFP